MPTTAWILCFFILKCYHAESSSQSSETTEYEIIREDLLRVHSSSNTTYQGLWNRVGFNGHDHDWNRRREIIDDWEWLKPYKVIIYFCDVLLDCETTAWLKIEINTKEIPTMDITKWQSVKCDVSLLKVPTTCSFDETDSIKTSDDLRISKQKRKFDISYSGMAKNATFLLLTADYNETVCPCDCIYYEKMEAFKNKTREKKSIEEIKEDLGPQLREMEKNLTVDTSTLSAYVSKKVSKDDKRQSSKQIGVVGIIFLTLELLTLILADLLSFRQHWTFIKECWCGFFKAVWDKVRR